MRQIAKKKVIGKKTGVKRKKKQEYGTSKLEQDFAHDFLDKLGIKYIYQYSVPQIGRYYDFAVLEKGDFNYITEEKDGLVSVKQQNQITPVSILIEIDGSYYHSDPRVVDENKLSPMQKHNKMVDNIKDKWALLNSIPLVRIWEYDIRKNPSEVMNALKKKLHTEDKKVITKENKNKRHNNKIKKT
jgi:hypothetical protein